MGISTFLTTLAVLLPLAPGEDESVPGPRLERRANEFTSSSQEAVVLAADELGRTVLAWQSRRQQAGTYGIYARRYDATGAELSGEVQVNAETAGMQMQPSVDLGADGTAWFAWRSFGADGDQGAIVARRFAADLASATHEVLVNQVALGNQTDPVIGALPDGGALVLWLGPDARQERVQVRARRLAADGTPVGDAYRIDLGDGFDHVTPALGLARDGRALVAYGRVDGRGLPLGLYVRALDGEGRPAGGELRVDDPREDVRGAGVEPAIDLAADGRALVGWLQPTGSDHEIRLRGLALGASGLELAPMRTLALDGAGYTSGLDVVLDGATGKGPGRGLVAWSRFADGEKLEAGLFACRVDAEGAPLGSPYRATRAHEGAQALVAACGSHRVHLDPAGRTAFAWSGDAGLGDASGAHLTLEVPEGYALASPAAGAGELSPRFAALEEGARPHDPPVFDPRQVEDQRRDDTLDPLAAADFDFLAFNNTGWTPPDPEMAVGPNHIVGIVNGGIAWYTKDGNQEFFQDINGQSGFWGVVNPSNGFVFDPEVVFDTHGQRFVAFASDSNAGFLLAVTDDADPNGNWFKYKILTQPLFGTPFVDSGNLAVDANVITLTGDIFSSDRLVMVFIDKTTAYSGAALVLTSSVINGFHSMGTPVNFDAGNQPQYLVWAEEFTTSTTLRIYAVTNQLSAPATQFTTVTVPSYSHPNDPPQMGTSSRPELFEARFWSAVVRDGHLWCTHHQGSSRATQRWYEFDLQGWPNSGNQPSLVQSGDIDLGAGIWTFFGSIWVDANRNAAMTFARSATNEFISMHMTHRLAGDTPGTMQPPVLVRGSTGAETSGRWGDYSATNDDPALPGSFWGHHEYREGSWRTRIARIDICPGGTATYCVTSPNSVGSGALMGSSGSTSIGANDFVLSATACPLNKFGLFYYGDLQTQVPAGDGFRCVGSSTTLFRLPVVSTGGTGSASYAVDYNNLPNGGDILPGSTWNFQFWYRDTGFGSFGYNFSDALQATFCN